MVESHCIYIMPLLSTTSLITLEVLLMSSSFFFPQLLLHLIYRKSRHSSKGLSLGVLFYLILPGSLVCIYFSFLYFPCSLRVYRNLSSHWLLIEPPVSLSLSFLFFSSSTHHFFFFFLENEKDISLYLFFLWGRFLALIKLLPATDGLDERKTKRSLRTFE